MTPFSFLVLIYCGFSLALLIMIVLVLRWIIRRVSNSAYWKTESGVGGSNLIATLLGLGVAAIVRPTVIPNLISTVINILYQLLWTTPLNLLSGLLTSANSCDSGYYLQGSCLEDFILTFGQIWSSVGESIYARLTGFSYINLLMFLIVWALATYLFRYASEPIENPRWRVWGDNALDYLQSDPGRNVVSNIVFFIVIGIGGYLSIAAIAAIPILQQQTQTFEEASTENLEQLLVQELTQFEDQFVLEKSPDPFVELTRWLEDEDARIEAMSVSLSATNVFTDTEGTPVDQSTLIILQQRRSRVQRDMSDLVNNLGYLHNARRTTIDSAIVELSNAKDAALNTYKIGNLNRIGSYENLQHFLNISSWYNQQVKTLSAIASECNQDILVVEQVYRNWADEYVAALKSNRYADVAYSRASVEVGVNFGFQNCTANVVVSAGIPSRQALGSFFLGPFGRMASWLLQTESLSLALITGMLGFGLLGAASSTVIREKGEGGRLVSDLSSVIIRGVSAAIVVFLAVSGGLAVFTLGETEPNPYVILFTCLIGAVYSEVIWERARAYLVNQVQTENVQPDDASATEHAMDEKGLDEVVEDVDLVIAEAVAEETDPVEEEVAAVEAAEAENSDEEADEAEFDAPGVG